MDYLLPEVGRVEPHCGNLQAGSIGGAFLKGNRMAKRNVSAVSSPPETENPESPHMSTIVTIKHKRLHCYLGMLRSMATVFYYLYSEHFSCQYISLLELMLFSIMDRIDLRQHLCRNKLHWMFLHRVRVNRT